MQTITLLNDRPSGGWINTSRHPSAACHAIPIIFFLCQIYSHKPQLNMGIMFESHKSLLSISIIFVSN